MACWFLPLFPGPDSPASGLPRDLPCLQEPDGSLPMKVLSPTVFFPLLPAQHRNCKDFPYPDRGFPYNPQQISCFPGLSCDTSPQPYHCHGFLYTPHNSVYTDTAGSCFLPQLERQIPALSYPGILYLPTASERLVLKIQDLLQWY